MLSRKDKEFVEEMKCDIITLKSQGVRFKKDDFDSKLLAEDLESLLTIISKLEAALDRATDIMSKCAEGYYRYYERIDDDGKTIPTDTEILEQTLKELTAILEGDE